MAVEQETGHAPLVRHWLMSTIARWKAEAIFCSPESWSVDWLGASAMTFLSEIVAEEMMVMALAGPASFEGVLGFLLISLYAGGKAAVC